MIYYLFNIVAYILSDYSYYLTINIFLWKLRQGAVE